MKRILRHIHHRTRNHRLFLSIIVVTFSGGLLINHLNGKYTERKVVSSFQQNFEKQAADQLQAYNFGLVSMFQTRLSLLLKTLENLVDEPEVQTSILSKNYSVAAAKFKNLINYDDRFDSVNVLDSDGFMRLVVNEEGDMQAVGKDFSARGYFSNPNKSKLPYMGDAFRSVRGLDFITFSVPILDENGNVIAIVVSGSLLSNIVSLTSMPKEIAGLYFSLLDSQGNLIMSKGESPTEIVNLKNEDSLVATLVEGNSGVVMSEINYLNDEVIARGDEVVVGNNKRYVVGYYLQSKYDHDLSVIKTDLSRTLVTSRLRSTAMFVLCAVIVFWVIRRYEKATKN
jgi:hypothetical protein